MRNEMAMIQCQAQEI